MILVHAKEYNGRPWVGRVHNAWKVPTFAFFDVHLVFLPNMFMPSAVHQISASSFSQATHCAVLATCYHRSLRQTKYQEFILSCNRSSELRDKTIS